MPTRVSNMVVWGGSSTANGNKKLDDAAYHEAKEKKGDFCPVCLLYSLNASSQFCGGAEMIGPVDVFDQKSVDYWQRGQFPHRIVCSDISSTRIMII
ncbi:hypothetical protein KSP40_PGU015646 [Platanthera guangdongensis]|uniref:YTH domain-containing family protein n=1 Tax=Platanthera guangdongensis TaxID=2320717 RepID=A0ABR2M8K5_9ASPA